MLWFIIYDVETCKLTITFIVHLFLQIVVSSFSSRNVHIIIYLYIIYIIKFKSGDDDSIQVRIILKPTDRDYLLSVRFQSEPFDSRQIGQYNYDYNVHFIYIIQTVFCSLYGTTETDCISTNSITIVYCYVM